MKKPIIRMVKKRKKNGSGRTTIKVLGKTVYDRKTNKKAII